MDLFPGKYNVVVNYFFFLMRRMTFVIIKKKSEMNDQVNKNEEKTVNLYVLVSKLKIINCLKNNNLSIRYISLTLFIYSILF